MLWGQEPVVSPALDFGVALNGGNDPMEPLANRRWIILSVGLTLTLRDGGCPRSIPGFPGLAPILVYGGR